MGNHDTKIKQAEQSASDIDPFKVILLKRPVSFKFQILNGSLIKLRFLATTRFDSNCILVRSNFCVKNVQPSNSIKEALHNVTPTQCSA